MIRTSCVVFLALAALCGAAPTWDGMITLNYGNPAGTSSSGTGDCKASTTGLPAQLGVSCSYIVYQVEFPASNATVVMITANITRTTAGLAAIVTDPDTHCTIASKTPFSVHKMFYAECFNPKIDGPGGPGFGLDVLQVPLAQNTNIPNVRK